MGAKKAGYMRKFLRYDFGSGFCRMVRRYLDKGFRKKKLKTLDSDYLKAFIKETCRAEWAHWMQIIPFWLFGFWAPPPVIWFMLLYALLLNMPCIIAQRYNRPRL